MLCYVKNPLKRPTVDQLLDFEWFENINMVLAPPLPTTGGIMGKIGGPPPLNLDDLDYSDSEIEE